jgi:protein-disulfide isomerase
VLVAEKRVAGKRASAKERTSSESQRRLYLLVGIVVVLAAVTVSVLASLSQGGASGEVQELLADIPQNGTTLGKEDAPVTVRLYEDLQCPACASFARETFPELVARHVETGEAKVVARTLAILGPDSVPAAQAALAAGEQDRY